MLNVCNHHLQSLLKHSFLEPSSGASDSLGPGYGQDLVILLVRGPHVENYLPLYIIMLASELKQFMFQTLTLSTYESIEAVWCLSSTEWLIHAFWMRASASWPLDYTPDTTRASLIAQLVEKLPAVQETPVWFLGWEDLLEKGQSTHSIILEFPLWLSW